MENKVKILVTSVGSLVGQNILDVLDFQHFRRRELVTVIGTNSIAGSPNNFRCDSCYIVSQTSTMQFKKELSEIIIKEKPDLILSGRDEDTEVVAFLMEENSELSGILPYGKASTLKYALDKHETANFCKKHNLPFAETYVIGKTGDLDGLRGFIEKYSYPLIAKPIQGFASKGVFFVRNWTDVVTVSKLEDYMFQEYLGDASKLIEYFEKIDGVTPLFAHAPNVFHHSCHTVISSLGEIDPIFISRNEHDSGVTIGFRKDNIKELEEATINYAKAIYREGGYGPVTVQFRQNKNGDWKAQEMNMRTNGNTFPRFLMGQDDLGLILNYTLPEKNFPIYLPKSETENYIIGKTLSSLIMHPNDLNILKLNKVWKIN